MLTALFLLLTATAPSHADSFNLPIDSEPEQVEIHVMGTRVEWIKVCHGPHGGGSYCQNITFGRHKRATVTMDTTSSMWVDVHVRGVEGFVRYSLNPTQMCEPPAEPEWRTHNWPWTLSKRLSWTSIQYDTPGWCPTK